MVLEAFRILDHAGLRAIHDGNAGVRGSEVNADDFGHVCIPLLQAMIRRGPGKVGIRAKGEAAGQAASRSARRI
jgi:hypothetical protein